jgi:hypothetical protein
MRKRCRQCDAPIHYRTLARVREALLVGLEHSGVEQKKALAADREAGYHNILALRILEIRVKRVVAQLEGFCGVACKSIGGGGVDAQA